MALKCSPEFRRSRDSVARGKRVKKLVSTYCNFETQWGSLLQTSEKLKHLNNGLFIVSIIHRVL